MQAQLIRRWIVTGSLLLLTLLLPLSCPAEADKAVESLARGTLLVDNTGVHVSVEGPLSKDAEEQADADSYFHIGSNTKAMTATMIAMLVEEGLLDWDTTVSEVWPQAAPSFDEAMRDVTLHALLTHRSGIRAFTAGRDWQSVPERSGDGRQRRIEFSRWLLAQAPAGQRGLYLYSNAGYCVASAMVEELSGNSWEQMLRERLFGPLGMEVQFGWPLDHDSMQPQGYLRSAGVLRPFGRSEGYSLPVEIAPAGDLSMPLGEYAKFLRLHLDGLGGEARLLTEESFAFLHEPVGHYACGWIVLDRDRETEEGVVTQRISSHDGSAGSFYLHTELNPAAGYAVAAVVNAGGDASRGLTESLAADAALDGSDSTK